MAEDLPSDRPARQRRPIITLTTDFGLRDAYVAELKAALLRPCPEATIIDATHQIPPQDVTAAAMVLSRLVSAFPPGSTHLCVVDPGVGTRRRLLAAEVGGHFVVCPDNGLLTWLARTRGPMRAFELAITPDASSTFHGRDVLAPAAAEIAWRGGLFDRGKPAHDLVLLDHLKPASAGGPGAVVYIDAFGNAVTNIAGPIDAQRVMVGKARAVAIGRTYADVPDGEPIALVGSSGLLEIAVRNGSAATTLGLHVGGNVELRSS